MPDYDDQAKLDLLGLRAVGGDPSGREIKEVLRDTEINLLELDELRGLTADHIHEKEE